MAAHGLYSPSLLTTPIYVGISLLLHRVTIASRWYNSHKTIASANREPEHTYGTTSRAENACLYRLKHVFFFTIHYQMSSHWRHCQTMVDLVFAGVLLWYSLLQFMFEG